MGLSWPSAGGYNTCGEAGMAANQILIVSKDDYVIQKLRGAFEADHYEVLVAQHDQRGWDLCRRHIPQALILDVDAPEIDGGEFLRQVRSAPRTQHIHVTILTEDRARQERIAGLKMGADDFVIKPFDLDEVRLRIYNALRQSKKGNLVDPATGLPGSRLIRQQVRELLGREDDWALLRLIIRHLDEFADARGFLSGEAVLRAFAATLGEAITELGSDADFIGHNGGEEFIVITDGQVAAELSTFLPQRFQEISQDLHTQREQAQGYITLPQSDGGQRHMPLLDLDIRAVMATDGPFMDIVQLTGAAE